MKNILVLCTGNSCRSIMAEALFNHYGKHSVKAVSAGSNPTGKVHPKSVEVLKRHGIAIDNPLSKSWHEFENDSFDLVVTVCDAAANEACPIVKGDFEKLHWSTPDPASVKGSDEEIDAAFENAFRQLSLSIQRYLSENDLD